jgi:propionyl-CoA carboxylase alpha chain
VDTGVYEGGEVSMYYDPMIAKLVTWGEDRDHRHRPPAGGPGRYHIRGVLHNISFLNALMAHPRFREGRLSTNLIAEEYPDGFHPADVPREDPARPSWWRPWCIAATWTAPRASPGRCRATKGRSTTTGWWW